MDLFKGDNVLNSSQFDSTHLKTGMRNYAAAYIAGVWVLVTLCKCSAKLHSYWILSGEPGSWFDRMKASDLSAEMRNHLLSRVSQFQDLVKLERELTATT